MTLVLLLSICNYMCNFTFDFIFLDDFMTLFFSSSNYTSIYVLQGTTIECNVVLCIIIRQHNHYKFTTFIFHVTKHFLTASKLPLYPSKLSMLLPSPSYLEISFWTLTAQFSCRLLELLCLLHATCRKQKYHNYDASRVKM